MIFFILKFVDVTLAVMNSNLQHWFILFTIPFLFLPATYIGMKVPLCGALYLKLSNYVKPVHVKAFSYKVPRSFIKFYSMAAMFIFFDKDFCKTEIFA
jgi:hypothetical protein